MGDVLGMRIMVHRESRDKLAEAIRHYVSGQIINEDLAEVEIDWRDRGAVSVQQMAGGLYSDLRNHKAIGKHKIEKEGRSEIARWIAFLYSNQEYLWPEYSFIQIVNWPMNIITFGWWEKMKKRKWEQFLQAGNFEVWPFCSKEELERVVKTPKLLAKKT